jgi:cytochrome d ubiquinol oxidase subunit II
MQAFWFGTIAVLWAGFFLLEGFDFGVGILLPLVTRNDTDRRIALRAIGPVWDGNEVWLLVAGGATFAAFPEWYASVFSGFYLAFALLLVGLILRGIGIEYRGKAATARGRQWCDGAVFVGSFLPALLIGVAFADFLRGVTMDSSHDMTNGFFSLLSPYALLGGLVTLSLFVVHGAAFLVLRTEGEVAAASRRTLVVLTPVAALLAAGFVGWTGTIRGGWVSAVLAVVIVIAVSIASALIPVWTFAALWPDVLPARNNGAFSLTVHNASSSPHTLKVMTVIALVFTPIVLVYQAWTYWIFRARVTGETVGAGHEGIARAVALAGQSARETLGRPDAPAAGPVAP